MRANIKEFPNLEKWFRAMESLVPSYIARVSGDLPSWQKVLKLQGYGNSGAIPDSSKFEYASQGTLNFLYSAEHC